MVDGDGQKLLLDLLKIILKTMDITNSHNPNLVSDPRSLVSNES